MHIYIYIWCSEIVVSVAVAIVRRFHVCSLVAAERMYDIR